jgi:hypothetical protein
MYGTFITEYIELYFATEFNQDMEIKLSPWNLSLLIYENSHWLYLRILAAGYETGSIADPCLFSDG